MSAPDSRSGRAPTRICRSPTPWIDPGQQTTDREDTRAPGFASCRCEGLDRLFPARSGAGHPLAYHTGCKPGASNGNGGDGMLRHRFGGLVILLLVLSTVAGTTLSAVQLTSAAEPVYLVFGSTQESDCRTWEIESSDSHFQSDVVETPRTACEGGVVWAIQTTHSEADEIRTARVASDPTFSARIVRMSGDESQDTSNVLDAMAELHEHYAAQTVSEGDREMPDAGSERRQGDCKRGKVPRYKKKHMEFHAFLAEATIQAKVYYKRWSCQQWEIYLTTSRLKTPANRPVRTLIARYRRVWWGGNDYRAGDRWLDCEKLSTDRWAVDDSSPDDLNDWYITTNGDFQYAVIADSDIFPPSCALNTGKEYTSAWVLLKGPNR